MKLRMKTETAAEIDRQNLAELYRRARELSAPAPKAAPQIGEVRGNG
ncbi:MAG: hypothetical protein JNM13_04920 [Hyphomicrobiaceae bacterium]|nr:hypothetical protein [Hyphomicrobiaceae bacterium]